MKLDQPFMFDARTRAPTTRLGHMVWSLALVGAAALALSSGAFAATPQEEFLHAVGKVAPSPPVKVKRLCRCIGGAQAVGELRPAIGDFSNGEVNYKLVCTVPVFDSTTGALSFTFPCPESFEIIAK